MTARSFDRVLWEHHDLGHECSYCEKAERGWLPVAFWIPKAKVFKAWWVLRISTRAGHRYLRFTLPFLPRPSLVR